MKKTTLILMLWASFALSFTACKKKEAEPTNESEVITTVRLTFTPIDASGNPIAGKTPVTSTWKDADGAGSAAPTVNNSILDANASYRMEIAVLNELANPVKDITEEILEEGTKHQFFFERTGISLTSLSYDDKDNDGKPIGLRNILKTGNVSDNNTLKVILRHEPNKNASGVSAGEIGNAGGETDIETVPVFTIGVGSR